MTDEVVMVVAPLLVYLNVAPCVAHHVLQSSRLLQSQLLGPEVRMLLLSHVHYMVCVGGSVAGRGLRRDATLALS